MPAVIFETIHDLIDLPPTTEGKRVGLPSNPSQHLTAPLIVQSNCT
jgi:hypothetical protein